MSSNKQEKKKKKVGDEDEAPLRTKVREFVEGKFITALMTITTLFALFGDDFRLWFTNKWVDPYFYGLLCAAFVLFALEVLLNSCVLDDFKYSFFFWLDLVATLSLIVDIEWLVDLIYEALGQPSPVEAADVHPGEIAASEGNKAQFQKIIKSLRLIRLIRIIKLYKYLVKSNSEAEEARLREQQKLSQNAQQAALKRELEPQRLGKALSDTLTRRLIIGVLLLLMVLPAITYQGSDLSVQFGLKKLFWFGRSNCQTLNGNFQCDQGNWITQEGWQQILRNFVQAARPDEASSSDQTTLWIYVPDYEAGGEVRSIQNITTEQSQYPTYWTDLTTIKTIKQSSFPQNLTKQQTQALNNWIGFDQIATLQIQDKNFTKLINFDNVPTYLNLSWSQVAALQTLNRKMFPNELFWQQDQNCIGFAVSENKQCKLRTNEMSLIMYTPKICGDGTKANCEYLVSYVRLNQKSQTKNNAMLTFMTTIFTCIILSAGALLFQNDTQKIVIAPITKMVTIIKTLADDPLQKPDPPVFEEPDGKQKENPNEMKTQELQKTIFRIGNLLQMSFGQLGALIIRENVSSGDGSLEIMIPGHRINVIFLLVRINHFVEITDVLKGQTNEFMNKVISIIHSCGHKWDGWANRNETDKYLITWKLPETENSTDNEKNEQLLEQRTELADKSLIAAVKIVSETRRAVQFAPYFRKPALYAKFGQTLRPYLTFGLHMGWTIEGAIGSEFKIDAGYISPNCQIVYRIEELCDFYQMQILVSEPLYNMMSLKARHTLRKIDVITMKEFKEPMGVYTFDLSFNNLDNDLIPEDHQTGDLIKLAQYETINIESFKNKGVDYMFTLDSDIVGLQSHIAEFNPIFRQAFKCYIAGDWTAAFENIERCLELWDSDGPTKALQTYMSYYRFQMPESWTGYRNIDEEINLDEIKRNMGLNEGDNEEGEEDKSPK